MILNGLPWKRTEIILSFMRLHPSTAFQTLLLTMMAPPFFLNQIPYDYTVGVRNRFKGLDLIDRVPDELWTEVCDTVQETGIKTIPMEKKCKKQNGCLRRPYK